MDWIRRMSHGSGSAEGRRIAVRQSLHFQEIAYNDRLRPVGETPMSTFYTALKTYNASQMQSDFEKTAFSCGICLEDRKGKSCIQMPGCGCVLFVTPTSSS